MLLLILLLTVLIIGIPLTLNKYGLYKEYTSYKKCRGVLEWYSKNKNTMQVEYLEIFLSITVSALTTIIFVKYISG